MNGEPNIGTRSPSAFRPEITGDPESSGGDAQPVTAAPSSGWSFVASLVGDEWNADGSVTERP